MIKYNSFLLTRVIMEMQLSIWMKTSNDGSVSLIVQSTTMGRRCPMDMRLPFKRKKQFTGKWGYAEQNRLPTNSSRGSKGSWELSGDKILKLILVISYSGHICPSNFPWNMVFQTLRIPITAPSMLLPVHRDAGGANVPALQWQLIPETPGAKITTS